MQEKPVSQDPKASREPHSFPTYTRQKPKDHKLQHPDHRAPHSRLDNPLRSPLPPPPPHELACPSPPHPPERSPQQNPSSSSSSRRRPHELELPPPPHSLENHRRKPARADCAGELSYPYVPSSWLGRRLGPVPAGAESA